MPLTTLRRDFLTTDANACTLTLHAVGGVIEHTAGCPGNLHVIRHPAA
jgi:hypothetical protein